MKARRSDIEYIEQFFRNLLSEEDKLIFNKRLQTDEEFLASYNNYSQFIKMTEVEGNKELKSFLQKVESGEETKEPIVSKPQKFNKKVIVLLLCFLLGMLTAYFVVQMNSSQSNASLYAQYYAPYPNTIVKLERAGTKSSDIQNVMRDYANGKHLASIEGFNKVLKSQERDDILFYKSIAQLSSDQNGQAISILETLKLKNIPAFDEAINWYLALAYLKTEQNQKAKNLLQQIVISQPSYQSENAKKLLDSID